MIGAMIAKRKVRSSFACLNQRDIEGFLANWAEDAHFIHPGNISVSGEMEGKEAAREWFQKFLDRFPGVGFALNSVCVEKICAWGGTNVVAVDWDIVLTDHEGQEFRNRGITAINLKKGKATLVRNYLFDPEIDKRAWAEG